MAKKEKSESKIVLERKYVIPLRSETLKVPGYRKAEKAAKAVREFISKHMKSTEVKIGRYLNMKLWEHGMKNPPGKIKVVTTKDDKGNVTVELEGAPKDVPKVESKSKKEKPEAPSTKEEKMEQKAESVKEEKAEEAKKVEHEEMKELQKEHPHHHAPKSPQTTKFQQEHPPAPKHE